MPRAWPSLSACYSALWAEYRRAGKMFVVYNVVLDLARGAQIALTRQQVLDTCADAAAGGAQALLFVRQLRALNTAHLSEFAFLLAGSWCSRLGAVESAHGLEVFLGYSYQIMLANREQARRLFGLGSVMVEQKSRRFFREVAALERRLCVAGSGAEGALGDVLVHVLAQASERERGVYLGGMREMLTPGLCAAVSRAAGAKSGGPTEVRTQVAGFKVPSATTTP